MSTERWTADQHYARGFADALGQTYVYLLRHGSEDVGAWLKRRERGFMALLPTDGHGNPQFAPGREEHWTSTPHTHAGTDCGGGEGCPALPATTPADVAGESEES